MKTIIEKLPKIELHLHLDGSVRVKTVSEILKMDPYIVQHQMVCDQNTQSLTDYLKKFDLPIKVMQTRENIKRITKELLEDLQKENVIYAEIRFAPFFHTKQGLTQQEVVECVLEEMKASTLHCNLILCCMRNLEIKQNLETLQIAKYFCHRGVVAIDLAGDESKFPNQQFEELFLEAKKLEIPYIIHAGEASNEESVSTALQLGAKRIGHGIQTKTLFPELNQKKVLLEICPQSNLNTKVVIEKKDLPIKQLYQNCLISINTDNRTVSNITLTKEYEDLLNLFDFTLKDIKQCNINAIECSFLSDEEKQKLKKQIEEDYYDTTY